MSVAIFALLLFASLLLILSLTQERIVFQPPRNFSPADERLAKRIEYQAADGQRLVGFLIQPPSPSRQLLLCFHGNADLAAWQLEWGREAARRSGHCVFLAEYRGYYGLGGRPTYARSRLDADAAYRAAVLEAGIALENVSYFGHSLGSAVAAELALRVPPRRLLLQAPFTSAREMGQRIIGRPLLLLWNHLSRVHFDNVAAVSAIDRPVSVVHGERDRIVPVRMGYDVYDATRVRGAFLVVPSAGHNDLPGEGGSAYWSWLVDALS